MVESVEKTMMSAKVNPIIAALISNL